MLLLLSALATAATYVTRTHAALVHQYLSLAQGHAAADAAIIDTISLLSDERADRHPVIGNSRAWTSDGTAVSVSVTRESGRMDVNTAEDDLILAFLQSKGLSLEASKKLLDELRDWQRADSAHRNRGDENSDDMWRRANISPRNAPLESLEELKQIPGWRTQPLECWMNSLTVYTRLPGVSSLDAEPGTLTALNWAQAHHLGHREWINEHAALDAPAPNDAVVGEVLRIVATARPAAGGALTSEWVGRLTGDSHRPFLTMRWNHVVLPQASCVGRA